MIILLTFLASLLPAKVDGDGLHVPLYGHHMGERVVSLKVVVPAGWDYDNEVLVCVNGDKKGLFKVSPFRRRCDTFEMTCDSPHLVSVTVLGKGKPMLFIVGLGVR